MERKFYKLTFTFEVLGEQPLDHPIELYEIANLTDTGDCVGRFVETKHQEIGGKEMADALYRCGSDPGFFMLDDDGNSTEDACDARDIEIAAERLAEIGDDRATLMAVNDIRDNDANE